MKLIFLDKHYTVVQHSNFIQYFVMLSTSKAVYLGISLALKMNDNILSPDKNSSILVCHVYGIVMFCFKISEKLSEDRIHVNAEKKSYLMNIYKSQP